MKAIHQIPSLCSRRLLFSSSCLTSTPRFFTKHVKQPRENLQIYYLKSVLNNKNTDWTEIKSKILSTPGNMTNKNIDAVIMKYITSQRKFDCGYSFANYLQTSHNELNLGIINSLLNFYYEFSKVNELSEEARKFILDSYQSLYDKHKVLDYYTSERLLHALCAIGEWKKSLKILDDIYLSSIPSHSAHSILISTLFKNNKKAEALKAIRRSLTDNRPLLDNVYDEWLKYILRKYKDKKTILKYLDEVCLHLAENYVKVSETTAERLKETFSSLDWIVNYTSIERNSGQCICCNKTLADIEFSDEEFSLLQQNIKEKLIVGSDLFLKTSPGELENFLKFTKETGPYDIVLDGLNIAYTLGTGSFHEKVKTLNMVVDYFSKQKKKILLLGRKHMYKWHAPTIKEISKKTFSFFTDNISQDDPYFITAAILSGSHTDIVSRDLLRGHKFMMKQKHLSLLFQKWQWKHQWMIFSAKGKPIIKGPLKFAPCAQKNSAGWHIPYEKNGEDKDSNDNYYVNSGDPDCSAWLCLKEKDKC